jgi:hypothetical protein
MGLSSQNQTWLGLLIGLKESLKTPVNVFLEKD